MVKAPVATAAANGNARNLTAAMAPSTPGRVMANHASAAKSAAAGKNPRAVNLQQTASPVASPSRTLFRHVGCSAQTSSAKKAAVRQPVSAISVVATPAGG